MPKKMVFDHFKNKTVNVMTEFWIRGQSCAWLGLVYAVHKLPQSEQLPICTGVALACGILYPWNAKYGYLSKGLKVKYPMHYVPEVLMAVLTVGGLYFTKQQ